jgi:hypothetical protein
MSNFNFESERGPYDLAAELKKDRKDGTIVINVGLDEHGHATKSLRQVTREVDHVLNAECLRLKEVLKLYIIGDWNVSFDPEMAAEEALEESSNPWTVITKHKDAHTQDHQLTWTKAETVTREEYEWTRGVMKICEVIKAMDNLKELT